jgi:hypothetical protein
LAPLLARLVAALLRLLPGAINLIFGNLLPVAVHVVVPVAIVIALVDGAVLASVDIVVFVLAYETPAVASPNSQELTAFRGFDAKGAPLPFLDTIFGMYPVVTLSDDALAPA